MCTTWQRSELATHQIFKPLPVLARLVFPLDVLIATWVKILGFVYIGVDHVTRRPLKIRPETLSPVDHFIHTVDHHNTDGRFSSFLAVK